MLTNSSARPFPFRLHHRVFKERHIRRSTQQRHYNLHQTAHPRDKPYSCVTLTTNLDFRHVNQCSATNATGSLRLSRRCLSFLATKVNNGCPTSGSDKGAMIFQRWTCDYKSSKFLFGIWKGYISAIWYHRRQEKLKRLLIPRIALSEQWKTWLASKRKRVIKKWRHQWITRLLQK